MDHSDTFRARPALVSARRRSPLALISTIVLAGPLLVGCGGSEPPPPQPPAVTVARPEHRAVRPYVDFTGVSRAIESAEVRARVSGVLEKMLFEPSHEVDAGDVLFVIEQAPYQAAYEEARAALKSARAELARADSDLERLQRAVKTKAVSESDVDRAQALRDQAEAAVLGAQARLATARLNLDYTEVRTPIDGTVGRNLVDIGNLVGQGEPTLLTTVNKMNPIFVYFEAPELVVLQFLDERRQWVDATDAPPDSNRAALALIGLANETGFPHHGVIDYIDNTVNPATGTIQMRAVVDNDDLVIFPGLFVRVRLTAPQYLDAILIDERAVGTDLGGKFVYVLDEQNIVEQRYVQLGALQEDGTIVIRSGLEGDETYIVGGMLRARPGMPVTPQPAEGS
jgi:RND family efflux transporter MFP subunit